MTSLVKVPSALGAHSLVEQSVPCSEAFLGTNSPLLQHYHHGNSGTCVDSLIWARHDMRYSWF